MSNGASPRLSGVRIWVTRPGERAQELCFLLEDEGAQVLCLPLLELHAPEDPRPLRAAAERVERYQWVVFSSRSAVSAWVEAVREAGSLERFKKIKIAAIGPGTAQAVSSHGLDVSVEAASSTGIGLFESIEPLLNPDDEVLLPVAEEGRDELFQALTVRGVRSTRVIAYRSSVSRLDEGQITILESFAPQMVLLASPRTAESLHENMGVLSPELAAVLKIVAIGPTTASAVRKLGLPLAAMASQPTPHGLVEAAISAL